ncbi:MAG: sodium:alanine symporter family protein [Marinilabiliales bacterium]|nr:MAG: sodium:alanine symporter family protein [Marinilabiliales bacterium]
MEHFLELIQHGIELYNEYVGGYLVLILLIPTGIYFTIRFKFLQISKIGHAIKIVAGKFDKKEDKGDVNHFKALTTALSATVGTGNIVGVSLAIYWGGPGAMFWIWVTGFLGMMLKMVECTLALKYRQENEDGSVSGGPMYYMEIGLKKIVGNFGKILAVIFAVAAVLCSFGTGNMAQSNSIASAMTGYDVPVWLTGIITTLLVLLIIVGGIKRIGEVTSRLVPIMAVLYFISAIVIISLYIGDIPSAFNKILVGAFTGKGAAGGLAGSAFMFSLIYGVRRGLFSNEAGQGSAAIAHAAAKTDHPMREGLVASLEPLIDTIIICTLTAMVIILTGVYEHRSEDVKGVLLTVEAFETGLNKIHLGMFAQHIVSIGLLLFAFSTIISWSYYGSRAVQYLFGWKSIKPYYYIYGLFVFLGCVGELDLVWAFVDMVITFMTIPNLIALILLSGVMKKEIDKYFEYMKLEKYGKN